MVDPRSNYPLNEYIKRTNLLLHSIFSYYLPTELIINILDLAERWLLGYSTPHHKNCRFKIIEPGEEVILATPPLSRQVIANLRIITFDFRSKVQGWCSDWSGGSWTWFEAVLCGDVNSNDRAGKYLLQRNEQAGKEMKGYHIELRKTEQHELFRNLRVGDRIGLVECAAFPGWVNYVESARLQLWMVDNLS